MADGTIVSLWRYPVKSMLGEELTVTHVGNRGLLGDRALALIDAVTGKVVSAKNPRKWPAMFSFRAALTAPAQPDGALPPVKVTLPDGSTILSDDSRFAEVVSGSLGGQVTLAVAGLPQPILEEYRPDMAELSVRETVTDETMPAGTFFDLATVHVLTTATIDRLHELYPTGRFETSRFRPNIVLRPTGDQPEFVESSWIGRELRLGDEVVLEITGHCPRCVMTTLPQGDLPSDSGILRTAARHNGTHVGVYAEVRKPGTIRRDDPVTLI